MVSLLVYIPVTDPEFDSRAEVGLFHSTFGQCKSIIYLYFHQLRIFIAHVYAVPCRGNKAEHSKSHTLTETLMSKCLKVKSISMGTIQNHTYM